MQIFKNYIKLHQIKIINYIVLKLLKTINIKRIKTLKWWLTREIDDKNIKI